MVLKVANGPGFEPSAKGRVSSKGLSLSFAFMCTLGAASAWGYSSTLTIWRNNKVMKICGARWLVCLPHAVPELGPELCPTGLKTCHLHSISIFRCENMLMLTSTLVSLILKEKAK
jgi:hypothetical protein